VALLHILAAVAVLVFWDKALMVLAVLAVVPFLLIQGRGVLVEQPVA
jgi:hypothetical protein